MNSWLSLLGLLTPGPGPPTLPPALQHPQWWLQDLSQTLHIEGPASLAIERLQALVCFKEALG